MTETNLYWTPAPSVTHPALTLAHARMRDATVAQIAEAIRLYRSGHDIGCFALAILPFLAVTAFSQVER